VRAANAEDARAAARARAARAGGRRARRCRRVTPMRTADAADERARAAELPRAEANKAAAGVHSGGACGRRPARKWAAAGDGGAENVYFIRRVSVQREAREGWTSIIFNECRECNIMGNNRSLPAWELSVTSTKRT
jgi:hypothetical protein